MTTATIARVNAALARVGREERLRRHGSGYYYVSGVACDSALYTHRLDPNNVELLMAVEHVEEVLANDGAPLVKGWRRNVRTFGD